MSVEEKIINACYVLNKNKEMLSIFSETITNDEKINNIEDIIRNFQQKNPEYNKYEIFDVTINNITKLWINKKENE